MVARLTTGLVIATALVVLSPLPAGSRAGEPPAAGAGFFDGQVRPILQAHCVRCHGGAKTKGGLDLTTREGLLKGGKRGPAVSPSEPEESLLLQAVRHEDLEMPPDGELTPAQVDALSRWVGMGTPWGEGPLAATAAGSPRVDDAARRFWSFRRVIRPDIPPVARAGWVRTPVDAFILARLEAAGLAPAPPASKTALLRRVTYDLAGLPPTPEEVDAFLADDAPDAYEKVVDRLLASPHYGERWARHWLDLVRFAETNGYEFDAPKPQAWRYRDYVIAALNRDKPYDRFIRDQLAGDELDPATDEGLIATGFYRLGPWDGGAPDRLQATYDELDDVVATTGQVFLGLTVNCARCHDHKIDPFPTADYYRLLAFFHGIRRYNPRGGVRPLTDLGATAASDREKLAALAAGIKAIEDALAPHLEAGERDDFQYEPTRAEIVRAHVPRHVSAADYERYRALARERAALERAKPQALCVAEVGRTPPETFVFQRGNPRSPGARVEPGFPTVLDPNPPALPTPGPDARTSGRRRVLADWIASPDNPLTARVMVNRLWQHHFGRGIVRSPSDFGYRGAPPTHPELLDWLASEFVARGWSLKAMHRLIVTSSAYRMSSRPDPSAMAKDVENDLFWRFDLRRLSAEEVRDSVLAVSGNLHRGSVGGPSVYPEIQPEVLHGQSRPGSGWPVSTAGDQARRSVYVHIKRSLALPILAAFDAADTDATCPARFATTQPTQALGLLNGEFLNSQARVFARTVLREAGDDPAAQVRLALRRATQRGPSAAEVARGVALLEALREKHRLDPPAALAAFCLLTLNLNEFVYLD
jgi:mono/diheme cytochrome c family protein